MRSAWMMLVLFLLTFAGTAPAGDFQKIKISLNSPADVQGLAELGLDFEGSRYKPGRFIELQVSQKERSRIEAAGYSTEVLINDLEAYYASRLENRSGWGFGYGSMGGNYTFTEMQAQLDSMIQLYPQLVSKKDTIGNSYLGKPIVAVKISDNPNAQENEPEVLFTALHHAREPQGMMTLLYYMWHLLENYGSDAEATFLVNNRQIWFVPVVNPDGYYHNQQTNPSGGGMWRLSARDNND
ncbi:MAG: M14 family zinc carboxypeptidase, partial [Calditrichia bacterium]